MSVASAVACPACQAKVEIPEKHRDARRATEEIVSKEKTARGWLERAGRPPSAFLSWLTFLDGGLFWGVVLPVLLPIGVCLGTVIPPQIALAVAHVRLDDVLADTHLAALGIGLPFVVLALGLLLAGFGRKRTLTVSGLQAALAARSINPTQSAPGLVGKGIWGCRTCAAPLAVAADAVSARCDYCSADNLVSLPEAQLAAVRSRRDRLGEVIRSAEKDWHTLRSDLRASLFWRLGFGGGLVALMTVPILGSKPSYASPSTLDLAKPPNEMPSFWQHRAQAKQDACDPSRWTVSAVGHEPCDEGCQFDALVSPLAGEQIEVVGNALPIGTTIALQPRLVRFADVVWGDRAVAHTVEAVGRPVALPVEVGGWYRVRLGIPDTEAGSIVRFCVRQAPKR